MVGSARRKAKLPRKILRVVLDDGSHELQAQANDFTFEEVSEEIEQSADEDIYRLPPNDQNVAPPNGYPHSNGHTTTIHTKAEPDTMTKSFPSQCFKFKVEKSLPYSKEKVKSHRKANKHQHPEPTIDFPYQCDVCDTLFRTLESLSQHQREVHEGSLQYVCRYCSKKFNDKYNMRKHVLIHVGEKRHKCFFCEKAFLRKDHLRSHLQTHYNRKFGCKICGKGFRTMEMYERHAKTHKEDNFMSMASSVDNLQVFMPEKTPEISENEEKVAADDQVAVTILPEGDDFEALSWMNEECLSLSETDASLTQSPNMDDEKPLDLSSTSFNKATFQCASCMSSFRDKLTLQLHEKECTGDSQKWHCLKCNIVFDESSTLRQHYDRVHSADKVQNTPSRWKCKMCEIDFPNSKDLSRHYAHAHKDAQLFPCSECPKTFTVWHNLKKHMLIHLGDKKHKCHVCRKGFVRKDHLNSHMKVHSGEGSNKFTCNVCGKVFRLKQMYTKHMSTHTAFSPTYSPTTFN